MLYLLRQLGARIAEFQKGSGDNKLNITFDSKQSIFMEFLSAHVDHFDTSLKSSIEQYGLQFIYEHISMQVRSNNKLSSHNVDISLDLIIDMLEPKAREQMHYYILLHQYVNEITDIIQGTFIHDIERKHNIKLTLNKTQKYFITHITNKDDLFKKYLLNAGFTIQINENSALIKPEDIDLVTNEKYSFTELNSNLFMKDSEFAFLMKVS